MPLRPLCRGLVVAALAVTGLASLLPVATPADAATPTVSVGGGAVVEGDLTRRYVKLTVSLSEPTTLTVTVPYATVSGTATAGPDYRAKSGTLTFTPGVIVKHTAITVSTDIAVEGDETFSVVLGTPTNATLGNAVATATIIDDDLGGGGKVSIGDAAVYETCAGTKRPRAIPLVTLGAPQSGPVVVQVTTVAGSALPGIDYTPLTKTYTFTSGQNNKAVTIPILVDAISEGDETFTVVLTLTSGSVVVGRGTGTITIHDCI
jgi:hypothetical protein